MIVFHPGEQMNGLPQGAEISHLGGQSTRLLAEALNQFLLILVICQPAVRDQRPQFEHLRELHVEPERSIEPSTSFRPVSTYLPEAHHGKGHPQCGFRLVSLQRPGQCRAQVVMVHFDQIQRSLIGTVQRRCKTFNLLEEPVPMAGPRVLGLPGLSKPFGSILTDGIEQTVPGSCGIRAVHDQERLVGQRGQEIDDSGF